MKRPGLFQLVIIAASVTLVAAGCNEICDPETEVVDRNPTSYLLVKQTWEHSSDLNGQSIEYLYNSDNRIKEIKRTQWGNVRVNNGPPQRWESISSDKFYYKNGVATRMWVGETGADGEFHMAKDGMSGEIVYSSQGKPYQHSSYTFDTEGKVTQIEDFYHGVLGYRRTIEYDSNGNLTKSTTRGLVDGATSLRESVYSGFDGDSGVNFALAIPGLPVMYRLYENMQAYSLTSPDNFTRKDYTGHLSDDPSTHHSSSSLYEYTYNEEGLPTEMRSGGWKVRFEYRKYRN